MNFFYQAVSQPGNYQNQNTLKGFRFLRCRKLLFFLALSAALFLRIEYEVVFNDYTVDNMELVEVNEAIRNHPVEVVGRRLRGYMTAMKRIV